MTGPHLDALRTLFMCSNEECQRLYDTVDGYYFMERERAEITGQNRKLCAECGTAKMLSAPRARNEIAWLCSCNTARLVDDSFQTLV
jgi:hypothetical protein